MSTFVPLKVNMAFKILKFKSIKLFYLITGILFYCLLSHVNPFFSCELLSACQAITYVCYNREYVETNIF